MTQLKVKTRGDSSPQGKQRVYFCCHPADFTAFFPEIAEEILARQNCAVWYADPDTPRDETFLDNLREMQLFVMPVTSRLLYSDNYALAVEFPFAVAHHIPVLPLMQEAGLDSVFNEKCGDLQFLDKHQTDPTALPYEEKLDKYLSGVLVGDELAAKVRAAFDAYVFLSYRKKDRQHAQELMRLIHQNEFCRDIAIWYDEFLTPGENFNEAIQAALEKSGLFVLAVTPNLVNEPNYIQQIEYPMAVEQEKPILPAEMVPTDRTALADKYPAIPPCADAHDQPALSAALLEAVQRLAIEENDRSPEHNFFIGLAYLSGIDVEVDHDRAVALITDAAEAGLVEAAQKLVDMYRSGVGVERDYEEAIRWQEKLVAIAEAAYAESPTEDTLHTLFWCLIYCGDYYEELWQSTQAKARYVKGEAVLRTSPLTENSYILRRGWFSVCHRLGAIFRGEGNLPEARRQYEQALSICEKNAVGHGAADVRRNLAVCHHDLGCICQAEGDLPQAKRHFEQALTVIEQIVAQVGSETVRRDTATVCHNLGDVCLAEGNHTDARRYGERALTIQTSLLEEADSAAVWRDVASSYQLLGDICKADNDAPQAREYYTQAVSVCQKLVETAASTNSKQELSISYERLGNVCYDEGDLAGAEQCFQQSAAIAEELAKAANTVTARRNLSVSYVKLGNIRYAQGNLAAAKRLYAQALEIDGRIAEETGTAESRRDLSICYEMLAQLAHAEGALSEARQAYEQALSIRETLLENSATLEAARDLLHAYCGLGEVCMDAEDLTEARRYYTLALELCEKLAAETGYATVTHSLICCYIGLGTICRMTGAISVAKRYYERTVTLSEKLVEEADTIDNRDALAAAYYNLTCLLPKRIAFFPNRKRKAYLQKALSIYEALCRECPGVARYRKLHDTVAAALK